MGLRAGLLARNSFGLILRFPQFCMGNLEEEGGNMSEYLLEMKGVCKEFPGVKALDNVSLRLRPGTVHALMGENGAGKSTLLKIMNGDYCTPR